MKLHQTKRLFSERNKTKIPPTKWENILANNISDKGLISKIHQITHIIQHKKTT